MGGGEVIAAVIAKPERVRAVAEVFKELGLGGVRVFEDRDPQMLVAREVCGLCGTMCVAILTVNAIVSYMLEVRGEEFWQALANHVRGRGCPKDHGEVVELIKSFTLRYNRRFLNAKLGRLRRLKACPQITDAALRGDLRALWKSIASCLGSDREAKTVVFAVKMAYYGLRASGKHVEAPAEIPIPVDFRVARITYLSQMVDVKAEAPSNAAQALMRRPQVVRRTWYEVSRLSGIPPLNLDAPIWVIGRYVELGRKSSVVKALRKAGITNHLEEDVIKHLIGELLYLLPD